MSGTKAHIFCENSSVGRARPCQGRGREFESRFSLKNQDARMVELVDTLDLKSNDHYDRAGSSPAPGTFFTYLIARIAQLENFEVLGRYSFLKVFARIAQLVEHDLAKVGVASSSLVSRSKKHFMKMRCFFCAITFLSRPSSLVFESSKLSFFADAEY